ncbi:hypothetical protein ACFO0A_06735 [Novosphingobium tardum]|uniref:Uncharacterized protein n=1 Tax=Novosphingobium tardum TaxID=1538021 RepID=A0ABV8RPF8_9SPHN
MFWADTRPTHRPAARTLIAAIAGVAALAGADLAQAQAVVVRSTGPSAAQYPQGRKLPASAKVTLKAGDRLTVIDKAGSRVLAGPGNFVMDSTVSRDQQGASRVAGLMTGTAAPRTRTGAVRGAPSAARAAAAPTAPDSIWYVDVSKGGTYCVSNPTSLVLWRPNRAEDASAKLTGASGKPVPVTWKRGSPLRQWPTAELPLTDGGVYTFADPVGPTVKIVTKFVSNVPADELGIAGLLADKGCHAQLDVLANALSGGAPGGMR